MTEEVNNQPCPNCGFEYPQNFSYCPECGQKNEDSVLTFKEMLFDLLGSLFSFDTRAVRSLPRLLVLPGSLTSEYIDGKRQTYLAPFRLYLFVSIVLFLVLPLVIEDKALWSEDSIPHASEADSTINEMADQVVLALDTLDINTGDAELDTLIEQVKNRSRNFNFTLKDPNDPALQISGIGQRDSTGTSKIDYAVDMIEEGYTPDEAVDSLFSGMNKRNRFIVLQALKMQSKRGKGLVSALLDKASYTLFIFLPVFALFLKLLYVRRKRFYIEHLIFSLHYFSFFFLLIIIYVLIYKFAIHLPFWIIIVIALLYLYAAMYKVYRQSWWRTIFKWFTLIFGTCTLFIPLFSIIALLISVIFYN